MKRVISEMDEDALNAMESSIPFYASKIRDIIEGYADVNVKYNNLILLPFLSSDMIM